MPLYTIAIFTLLETNAFLNKFSLQHKVVLCSRSIEAVWLKWFTMKWLKYVSPMLIIAAGFIIILLRYLLGADSAEVKSSMSFIALPIIGGCIIADFIIKKGLKWKLLWIWITEIVLLLVVVYLWIIAE
jgi:hypothetical protein